MLTARVLPLAPEPLALARRVADWPGVAFLWSADGRGPSYLGVEPSDICDSLDPEPELALGGASGELERAPRWIGVLPYDALRSIERRTAPDRRPAPSLCRPVWQRYGAVAEIAAKGVRVVGDDARAVDRLSRALSRSAPATSARLELRWSEAPERHRDRIARALELIAKGDLYQVNLARPFDFGVQGNAVELLALLARRSRPHFGAALTLPSSCVVASSPELALRLTADRRLLTIPIKGTRPRGGDAPSDAALAAELDADPKERAELAMIIDVERNDLGRVAEPGTVRLLARPRVVTLRSVHHRVASIGAILRAGLDRTALMSSMLPSGSVTGAPKIRAMDAIAELEASRRGLYTGAYGLVRHDGGLELAMAIRVLSCSGDAGRYFAGGGIVADSIPAREVEETHWKAVQVLAASRRSPEN